MPCWARAADLTSPRIWRGSGSSSAGFASRASTKSSNAGRCDRCEGVIKDDLLVREWTSGSAARDAARVNQMADHRVRRTFCSSTAPPARASGAGLRPCWRIRRRRRWDDRYASSHLGLRLMLWQAVKAVDPDFPRHDEGTCVAAGADQLAIARALRRRRVPQTGAGCACRWGRRRATCGVRGDQPSGSLSQRRERRPTRPLPHQQIVLDHPLASVASARR